VAGGVTATSAPSSGARVSGARVSGAERGPTVADQLQHALGFLPPAERRVARTLLAVYPAAGLGTVAGLAVEAATSTATVVRLVQKLGYAGFPEFQETLRRELAGSRSGPLTRLDTAVAPGPGLLAFMAGQLGGVASSIATTVPQAEMDAAVGLLADRSRRVFLAGGLASHPLAEVLGMHLDRLRAGATVLPRDRVRRLAAVLDLGPRDVVVAVDIRRYEAATVELAARARERRARLVVVTDTLLSPAARDAAVVLPVAVDSPSPMDTMVAALSLLEVLVLATMHAIGLPALERMAEWEQLMARETAG
jgi:DNA-binding MurR/RpiR family transcriptional regulator